MCNYVDVPFRKSSLGKFPNYFPNLKKLKIWNLSETDEEWLSSTPCPHIWAKVGTVDKRNWWLENYELLSERLLALRRKLEVKVSLRSELCEVEEQIQLAEYQISVLQNTWYGTKIGIKYGHVFYCFNTVHTIKHRVREGFIIFASAKVCTQSRLVDPPPFLDSS